MFTDVTDGMAYRIRSHIGTSEAQQMPRMKIRELRVESDAAIASSLVDEKSGMLSGEGPAWSTSSKGLLSAAESAVSSGFFRCATPTLPSTCCACDNIFFCCDAGMG